jgi:SSS family solute:Na+ symporter
VSADAIVLVTYLTAVLACGLFFARTNSSTDEFMAAGRSLPGWAVGLSMFGSYISSISFLASPGKAYSSNWNAFVFSLSAPVAAWIAVRWFMPFYRSSGEISAYEHLEHRFGPWARLYATVCFLLTQMARMGTIIYLLALAVGPLTGWNIYTTILLTGAVMTMFTLAGGIKAVVWVGVVQSAVLIAGTSIAFAAVVYRTPGGIGEILHVATAQQKFGLGTLDPSLSQSTFWVLFFFGLVTHLGNFGTDQSYIQRYLTAKTNCEAAKSIWITAVLYVPVTAVFFFIGTGLFVFYGIQPGLLPPGLNADGVFPHFISTQLPPAAGGLVVAAVFAASMDSNLNSMATLTLCDIYQRYIRPTAGESESMWVLRLSTFGWGVLSVVVAIAMMRVGTVLDVWWQISGLLSGGVLGLFLLGLISRRADNATALVATAIGLVVLVVLGMPQLVELPPPLRLHIHTNLAIVFGTLTIFLVGMAISTLRARPALAVLPEEILDR